ncbi:MAG: type IV secretion system DNA-binding domain-containing protein [Solirubrobacteraceae bacterium]
MSPDRPTSNLRRYLSLALLAGLLLAPSLAWAIGMMAAVAIARAVGPGLRWLAKRREARTGRALERSSVLLGRDPAGRAVHLSDGQLAAHALILGASGSGKTTTLLSILRDQVARGNPVVAIDMKGSPAFAKTLGQAAASAGRELRIWTPDGACHWNPLAHGNATALKDKLISTERFTEPHFMRAAERYVQTVLQVLHAAHPERAATLEEVVSLMEPRRLATRLRDVPPTLRDRVQDYLGGLTPDQLSAARGLGTRLAVLSESTAGAYLAPGPPSQTIDLRRALEGDQVVLFSLNSSVYGNLAAQLGALAIQDLTTASGQRLERLGPGARPATVAIDEFSALGADHVLALFARGREAGTSVLAATQELADLERAGRGFGEQVLGITGVKVIHRQEVPGSALTLAQMIGTEWRWEETQQLPRMFARAGASRGTRHPAERFLIDPNEIKTLRTGHAVLLTRMPSTQVTRVRVAPPALGPPPPAPPTAPPPTQVPPAAPPSFRLPAQAPPTRSPPSGRSPRGRAGPDHPAPGVTR